MHRFSHLLDRLAFMPSRNGKLRLMERYFAETPDPDRGWGLAALTGGLDFANAKPALVRALITERVDPELFGWSYDFVGDLAETASLIWPAKPGANRVPELHELVERLQTAGKTEVPKLLEGWLDAMDATGRWVLLKLITGGLRVGVSARLTKTALAGYGGVDVAEIEEVWHALEPPFEDLFAWLDGRAPRPSIDGRPTFRPLMLATPLDEVSDFQVLDPAAHLAEWKWDGIRVQVVAQAAEHGGARRLYSRTGDDIGQAFPDVIAAMQGLVGVLDGELLVRRPGPWTNAEIEVAPFNDLQQRLNRKTVGKKMLAEFPAFVRLYDILYDGLEDIRHFHQIARRDRLEAWHDRHGGAGLEGFDVSPLVPFESWEELGELRAAARENAIEGLMIKRCDTPYVAGRPKGPWFKWKRDALTLDCVVMYAQRGHGKRSSFYSDYTFGCWRADPETGADELVPVGKAYFGFTDAELAQLDKWVRNNTTERFGPVRAVAPGLVVEVAFDSVHRSKRHKSGVAMRFPRFHRIRWDKPAPEADRLESLERMIVV
ncbi:MAG: cisplatin damage response ATP-dependent DNA ligase [Alphaproteobacteria bacterium]|nr:cisplatin damage response ATP-dependent DNA ligase [Alphaproteobacteria bacterium]